MGVVSDRLDDDEQSQARVGTVLNDKWTLERLIGIGGMAAVYEARHRNGAKGAVKVLHPSYARRADVRERFIREGYAANRVNHSGVVKVLDDDLISGGVEDGTPFLVMELLQGASIEDRLEHGPPISEGELLSIMRAILDVLEVAHKAGVVHRDLKPDNLFLARDPDKPDAPPKIKILDFGLARVTEKGGGKTVVGLAIGTPSYMPPEQASGRIYEIDARSDLFALAATCFRVLAGRTVLPAEDAAAICIRMATEPAPKIRTVAPDVSSATAAVIDRALLFKREERWPDAAAMRDAVDKAIEKQGGATIVIDSGMLEVSDRVEPRSIVVEVPMEPSEPPAPPPKPAKKPSVPSRESEPSLPMKRSGSSFLVWLLVLAAAGVGGKLAYDKYGKTILADAMDGGLLAPIESAVSFDLASDAGAGDAGAPDARPATTPSATPPPPPTHGAPSKRHHDAGAHAHH